MRKAVRIVIPVVVALAIGFVGFQIGLHVPRTLGGVDLQAQCNRLVPGSVAQVDRHNVKGWTCYTPGQDTWVDVTSLVQHQCTTQYGPDAVAFYTNYTDPYSWKCKR